jgi:CRP/FNR family transcriptional regulator, cyclic AMP receptor protein
VQSGTDTAAATTLGSNGSTIDLDTVTQQQVRQMSTRNTRASGRNTGSLLDTLHVENTRVRFRPFETIFTQGDSCAAVMYIQQGRVKLTVMSHEGREAVVGILTAGAFFGEGALAGQRRRRATAKTMTSSTIAVVKVAEMRRGLHEDSALSDWFRSHLLTRCEKRLARTLLLLAHVDTHDVARYALPIISRNLLAETIGTTRSKVDVLMNKFRKLGFLERHSERNGGLYVHRSMLNVLLRD